MVLMPNTKTTKPTTATTTIATGRTVQLRTVQTGPRLFVTQELNPRPDSKIQHCNVTARDTAAAAEARAIEFLQANGSTFDRHPEW